MKNRGTAALPERLTAAAYMLMTAGILAVCLCLPWILYAKKQAFLPNVLLLPAGVCLLAGAAAIAHRIRLRRGAVAAAACAVCLLQMVMISRYYFYTDWDVETVVECAMASVTGADISRHSAYFSMYPNNLVLVTLFGWVVRCAYALGLGEYAYFAILVFQCVICQATGLMLYALAERLLGSRPWACTAYILFMMLVTLSPWISIPYSDAVALFFPTAILAAYFLLPRGGKAGLVRLLLLAFLSYFGYRIKPQALIVTIALVLIAAASGLRALRRIRPAGWAALAAGLIGAMLLADAMAADVDVTIDSSKTFGVPHFLMMGMNPDDFGVYSQPDVSASWRCETQEARNAYNLSVLGERLEEMGPLGLCRLLIRKTLTNFNDGTFCWAGEGVFYREIPQREGALSSLLGSVYYSDRGALYPLWANAAQAIWLGVLLFSALAALRGDGCLAPVMLALIGLTVFETLFEARARYFFCYAPLYILLAAAGMEAAVQRIRRRGRLAPCSRKPPTQRRVRSGQRLTKGSCR